MIDVTSPARCGRKKPGLRIHRGDRVLADEITIERGRAMHDRRPHPARPRGGPAGTRTRGGGRDERAPRTLRPALGEHPARSPPWSTRERPAFAGRSRAFDPELIRTRSETEARFYCACVEAGLPRPLVNRLVSAGEAAFEVDLHWPAARLILEVDSPFHDTTAARARDRARDAALRSHGWTVLRRR